MTRALAEAARRRVRMDEVRILVVSLSGRRRRTGGCFEGFRGSVGDDEGKSLRIVQKKARLLV